MRRLNRLVILDEMSAHIRCGVLRHAVHFRLHNVIDVALKLVEGGQQSAQPFALCVHRVLVVQEHKGHSIRFGDDENLYACRVLVIDCV